MKEVHVHDFKLVTITVPLHNYVSEEGKFIKDLITGKDTLKQLVCACGEEQTLDLKRKLNVSSTKIAANY